MADLRVLSVASEVYPLIKTGGLADVAGALPDALAEHGVAVRTLLPAYPVVRSHVPEPVILSELTLLGQSVRLLGGSASGLDVILADAPALFDRPGGPYAGDAGDYPDNWLRFAVLCRAALAITHGAIQGYRPDIVHAHDWQGALAPTYLRYAGRPVPSVLTIHNIAFQGQFGADIFGGLDLPPEAMAVDGIEYYGDVGTLKGGLQAADAITTVSPTYAREILDPQFGMGLEGVISARRGALHGIVNGIDTVAWDPTDDTALVKGYSSRALKGRCANKAAVEEAFGLAPGEGPILTVVSRLTWQKGMDVLAEAVDGLVARGARLALLGTGDPGLEAAFRDAADRYAGRVGAIIGYDERLAHLVQGGADAILIPSRFEPCGLTQLYGLRYGCVPVVARTGGLADTVIDANAVALKASVATGVVFGAVTVPAVLGAVDRVCAIYADPKSWQSVQRAGMRADVSWSASALAYARVYRSLVQR